MDGITPLPKAEADARYELARLAEILPQTARHLRTLGVQADDIAECEQLALALRARVAAAREAALLAQSRSIAA